MSLTSFFLLQLHRILNKPVAHATGAKKPTLAQLDKIRDLPRKRK